MVTPPKRKKEESVSQSADQPLIHRRFPPDEIFCPTASAAPDGTPHTIQGCGSYNVDGPDHEGLYDCLDCGLFFTLEEASRVDPAPVHQG